MGELSVGTRSKKTDRVGTLAKQVDVLAAKLDAALKELEAAQRRLMALEAAQYMPRPMPWQYEPPPRWLSGPMCLVGRTIA